MESIKTENWPYFDYSSCNALNSNNQQTNNKGKSQMYDGIAIRWSKDWRLKVNFLIVDL